MTYSDASSYANEHYPKDKFDTFEDWLEDSTNNQLNTPELLDEPEYLDMMERYWMDEVGSLSRDEEQEDTNDVIISKDTLDTLAESSGSRVIYTETPINTNIGRIEEIRVIQPIEIPRTGSAPEIRSRFTLDIQETNKITFTERIKGFFRRFKK